MPRTDPPTDLPSPFGRIIWLFPISALYCFFAAYLNIRQRAFKESFVCVLTGLTLGGLGLYIYLE